MTWLVALAWKNLWRNRSRTLISMAAVFFAVMLSVLAGSLKEGVFNNLVKNVVGFYIGYVQVHQKGYWDEQILDNSFRQSAELEARIRQQGNVKGLAPRLESFALASSEATTKGCLVVGIDPQLEKEATQLDRKLVQGAYLQAHDKAVLLAEGLARRLQLHLADTLVLIGQGYHGATAAGKYPVKGIVRFGSPDLNDRSLFMPLPAAQDLYGAPELITAYVLLLHNTETLQATTAQVQQALPQYEVMNWGQMLPDVKQHIETDSNNMKYVQYVLYMLITFGIFGTLLMMMMERRYEMGMLVAIGMTKGRLMALVVAESVLTVLAGCLLGLAASVPLVYYLQAHPLRMGGETAEAYKRFGFEPIFPTATDANIFIDQGITVLVIGLLLAAYPAYQVMKLDPVTAMKR